MRLVHPSRVAMGATATRCSRITSCTLARPVLRMRMQATSGDGSQSDASVDVMTAEKARELLRLNEGASFEEVVNAKNGALARAGSDSGMQEQVEKAYDVLLMSSMKARLEGSVDSSVRFADVPKYKPPVKKEPVTLPGDVKVMPVDSNEALFQAAIFGTLTLWTVAQGLSVQPGMPDSAPGTQIALALAAGIYIQKERKRNALGKGAGITVAGLLAGVLIGSALQAWLRVDIVPVLGVGSPGAVVGTTAILAAWAATAALL